MKILLITVFAAMCLVSSGAQVDDTALRIVKMKLSLIPLDGIRFDESEMGRTEFLRELLKPEFREMRILYALMLSEGEQPRITEFNSRAKTKEAGTPYQEVPLFCCHDGDLALLREYVRTNLKKKGEQPGADQPATKPADKPPAEMALEGPKSIDATFELLLQNVNDYNNVESPWEDNHGDMEGSLTRLMEAEVNIWQIIESLPEGARGSSTASRVGTLLHEEFLCVATRAVKVFARHPNPRLLKLVIAHLEAYPYSWSAEGWDDLLSNLKKVQKPTPDKDKAKDAEQVVPSDGHKPSSRVPSDGPIAPADAH